MGARVPLREWGHQRQRDSYAGRGVRDILLLILNNQFGTGVLGTVKEAELCIPSTKTLNP